jgi:hypothetical protein
MKKLKTYRCIGCEAWTSELHEIIPGNGRRDICIKYSIQVPVCRHCHETAHGKINGRMNRINDGRTSINPKDAEKRLCELVGVDYYTVKKAVWTSDIAELKQLESEFIPWLKGREL